jgi:UPF0716 protein FxsA
VPAVLFVAFLVVPVLEIAVILQVGSLLGGWQTAALLLTLSALGAWIVRREGRRAWHALRTATAAGRVPAREAADGALVLVGGTLLLTPGFLTDALGLLLVLPPSRALVRAALVRWAAGRVRVAGVSAAELGLGGMRRRPSGRSGRSGRRGTSAAGAPPYGSVGEAGSGPGRSPGPVVRGEVVDDDPPR